MKQYFLLLSAAALAATANANIIHHAKNIGGKVKDTTTHLGGKVKDTTTNVGGKVAQEVGKQVVDHKDQIIDAAVDATVDIIVPNIPYSNVVVPIGKEIVEVINKKAIWVTTYSQVAFKTGPWKKFKKHFQDD